MIRQLLAMLKSPSDYRDDPVAAAGSQCGHVLIGAGLAVAFGVWVAVGIALAWETVQLVRFGARKADYYADAAFFAAGAAVVLVPVDLWIAGCLALVGVLLAYRVTK